MDRTEFSIQQDLRHLKTFLLNMKPKKICFLIIILQGWKEKLDLIFSEIKYTEYNLVKIND